LRKIIAPIFLKIILKFGKPTLKYFFNFCPMMFQATTFQSKIKILKKKKTNFQYCEYVM